MVITPSVANIEFIETSQASSLYPYSDAMKDFNSSMTRNISLRLFIFNKYLDNSMRNINWCMGKMKGNTVVSTPRADALNFIRDMKRFLSLETVVASLNLRDAVEAKIHY